MAVSSEALRTMYNMITSKPLVFTLRSQQTIVIISGSQRFALRGTAMSAKIMGMVFDLDLPVGEKLVMLAYADHADHQGGNIFPSTALICKKTGYSESQVRRIVRSLEQKKLLVLLSGDKGGSGITKHYKIPLDEKGVIVTPFSEKRVSSDTKKGVIATAEKGVIAMTPEPSLTINLTINSDEKNNGDEMIKDNDSEVVKEHKLRIQQACERGAEKQNGKVNVTGFPADVTEVIQVFCELWDFRPPENSKINKSYWIDGGRALLDACGEFGVEAIKEYHKDFERYLKANNGDPPFTITSPRSIEGVVRKKAAEMRSKGREVSQDNSLPSAVYEIKGAVVSVGGRRFYNGKELIDERPAENISGT